MSGYPTKGHLSQGENKPLLGLMIIYIIISIVNLDDCPDQFQRVRNYKFSDCQMK